ncbi:carbohydrate ABC transporter permease, partial [Vallitalea guaymasensis]
MKNKIYKTLKIMALVLFVFSMLFPILYALSTSFMTTAEIESFPTKLIPSKITFDNFKDAFRIQPIMHYVKNSFIITFMTVFINLIIGSMAAYALTRTNIKFKKLFLIFVLTITLLPSITIINPIFQMYSKLNLLNTYYGLALIVAVLDLPMTIWFLSALFKDIPIEFEESAEIDGANLFQKFVYILIPIVKS